jgi:signal transduction histidine kinase
MLFRTATKHVPTTKHFIQPYFMDIAPDGAVKSVCARCTALVPKQSTDLFRERNIMEVFARLGKTDPGLFPALFKKVLPKTIDLFIDPPGQKPFVIRWTPTPLYAEEGHSTGWQLTGMKIYNDCRASDGSLVFSPGPPPPEYTEPITLIQEVMDEKLLNQELNRQKGIFRAIVDAQEKERAEIGRELHDNINQILSTTKLYLELAKNDHKERMSLINRSADNIHQAIHEIRNISMSLVPASIGDLGLLDSIADLVENLKTTQAIQVRFYPAGKFEEKISDKEKLMLFRIVQEQVNNVLRHSGASNLTIELSMDEIEKRIELIITDDGIGFNPEAIKNKKGLGFSSIISRADLFGGKATILSSPGCGCKLCVYVPVL